MFLFILCGYFPISSGLILPMTNADGTADLSPLEPTVVTSQAQQTPMESETEMAESELQTGKSYPRDQQLSLDADIQLIKQELAAVKAELGLASNELISVKSELQTLKTEQDSLKDQFNTTALDSDVKSNMADIQMIRTNFQTMNNSLKASATELNEIKENVSRVSTDLQHQESEVTSELFSLSSTLNQVQSGLITMTNDVYHVEDSLRAVLSQLAITTNDVSLMRSDMASLRQNISRLAVISQGNSQTLAQLSLILESRTRNVSFSAHSSSRKTGRNKPLKFDNVDFNIGNGFDGSEVFTAPVSGTYIFYVQVEMRDDEENTYINILQSDNFMAKSWVKTYIDIDAAMVSVTTISYVKQGEQVWITSEYDVRVVGGIQTRFLGALITGQ